MSHACFRRNTRSRACWAKMNAEVGSRGDAENIGTDSWSPTLTVCYFSPPLLQLFQGFALGTIFVEGIERITTADHAVARRGGAVAEGTTNLFSGHPFARQHVGGQVQGTTTPFVLGRPNRPSLRGPPLGPCGEANPAGRYSPIRQRSCSDDCCFKSAVALICRATPTSGSSGG